MTRDELLKAIEMTYVEAGEYRLHLNGERIGSIVRNLIRPRTWDAWVVLSEGDRSQLAKGGLRVAEEMPTRHAALREFTLDLRASNRIDEVLSGTTNDAVAVGDRVGFRNAGGRLKFGEVAEIKTERRTGYTVATVVTDGRNMIRGRALPGHPTFPYRVRIGRLTKIGKGS